MIPVSVPEPATAPAVEAAAAAAAAAAAMANLTGVGDARGGGACVSRLSVGNREKPVAPASVPG